MGSVRWVPLALLLSFACTDRDPGAVDSSSSGVGSTGDGSSTGDGETGDGETGDASTVAEATSAGEAEATSIGDATGDACGGCTPASSCDAEPDPCTCGCAGESSCIAGFKGGWMVESCPDGTCFTGQHCADELACVVVGSIEAPEFTCVETLATCEEVRAAHDIYVGLPQPCGSPSDCQVLSGACSVGLGDCYFVRSTLEYAPPSMTALTSRWFELGCGGVVCDCAEPPPAQCIDGVCSL